MANITISTEPKEANTPFYILNKAFEDKKWYCGPETEDVPVYFGRTDILTEDQLEKCRLYPRIKNRHFPYGISSTLIGLWNTIGKIQGRYDRGSSFSFKQNLLSPIVLKYPDDFPTSDEFIFFTKEFYSGLRTMSAHGGKLDAWTEMNFDPSLDMIKLSHSEFPTIHLESTWWHERRHSQTKSKLGYPSGGFYYLGLDILTKNGASVELNDKSAYSYVPSNITQEHRTMSAIAPLFPSSDDWKNALGLNEKFAIQEFKNRPWFNLLAENYRNNIEHLSPARIAQIGGIIQDQILRPDIFGYNFIDVNRLGKYRIERPDSMHYTDYFPPRHKYMN